MIHNTLKFIESFKVISLFSYQCSLCRSRRQLVYYILSSLFCQELFLFFRKFFQSGLSDLFIVSNATTLISYHVLFCLSTTFLFCCNFLNCYVFLNNLQFFIFTTHLQYNKSCNLSTTISKKFEQLTLKIKSGEGGI